jgi:LemA protein
MKLGHLLLVVGAFLAATAGWMVVSARTELSKSRDQVESAWKDLDAALQQRLELVPRLVGAVRTAAPQEKTSGEVEHALHKAAKADIPVAKIQANLALDQATGRLLVAVENYPHLRSAERFLRLQEDLKRTEDSIAVERLKYNETLQRYNRALALFPANVAASIFGFSRNDAYFRTEPASIEGSKARF